MQQSITIDPSLWDTLAMNNITDTVSRSDPLSFDNRYVDRYLEMRRRYVTPIINTRTNTSEDLYIDEWYESVERPWIYSPMEDRSAPSAKYEHGSPTSAVPFIVTDGDVMRDLFGLEDESD